jgi:hypothetical protein
MSRTILIAVLGIWFGGMSFGFWKALDYERAATQSGSPPVQWPVSGAPQRNPTRPTLLIFIHPKCPCTRATLRELDRLLAHHQKNELTVLAIFLSSEGHPSGWEKTDLWTYACGIPGVQALADARDSWRKMFHAKSSGECLLYSPSGELRFHGGITSGRGHEGYSGSQTSLSRAIAHESTSLQRTAVFGCALGSPNRADEVVP